MAHLIDKDALVAEIEKLKSYLQIPNAQLEAIKVCDNVISVINNIEVKEVDLEKEIELQIRNLQGVHAIENGQNWWHGTYDDLREFARYFAEWKKEQMTKDAIEREAKIDAGGYPYIDATELYDYDKDIPLAKAGDKVKVIIMTK